MILIRATDGLLVVFQVVKPQLNRRVARHRNFLRQIKATALLIKHKKKKKKTGRGDLFFCFYINLYDVRFFKVWADAELPAQRCPSNAFGTSADIFNSTATR